MRHRLQEVLPLAVAVAALTFVWTEVSLNFTFHWVTAGDLGIGLELPANFQLITPTAFISWAVFFALGADNTALGKALVSSAIGATAALVLMLVAPKVADLPDFWGLAVVLTVLVLIAVLLGAAGDWYFTPGVFVAFAAVVLWWFATGLDGWAENGGGVGNSVEALGDPATAGSGAFGGVLSTPFEWVYISSLATLAIGVFLGALSAKIAALLGFLAPRNTADTKA